jgi:hypothetical protein
VVSKWRERATDNFERQKLKSTKKVWVSLATLEFLLGMSGGQNTNGEILSISGWQIPKRDGSPSVLELAPAAHRTTRHAFFTWRWREASWTEKTVFLLSSKGIVKLTEGHALIFKNLLILFLCLVHSPWMVVASFLHVPWALRTQEVPNMLCVHLKNISSNKNTPRAVFKMTGTCDRSVIWTCTCQVPECPYFW